jgi:hypothetical protein
MSVLSYSTSIDATLRTARRDGSKGPYYRSVGPSELFLLDGGFLSRRVEGMAINDDKHVNHWEESFTNDSQHRQLKVYEL